MLDNEKNEFIIKTIESVLFYCGFEASIEVEDSITKGVVFNLSSYQSRDLIGRGGSMLKAIEHIVQSIAAQKFKGDAPYYFSMDVDDYMRKREWYLKETAKAAAEKVKMTGKALRLEPMPNYERKLIHAYIQENYPALNSSSQGNDPHRRIVIKPGT
ncbi:MAG TPA: R3H domain-containing nucleic acid-binding protein [Patescibacteria group bacterium]|nr:R3H domain-containing nucleic acid-binding protein [Patescibacteria group bacterium]